MFLVFSILVEDQNQQIKLMVNQKILIMLLKIIFLKIVGKILLKLKWEN